MMILSIILIVTAFVWLLSETNYLRLRLLIGKLPDTSIKLLPAAKPILMLPQAKKRSELSMTIGEWEIYNKEHSYELAIEQRERTKKQLELKAHYCPLCKKDFEIPVKTTTYTIGNSTFTITGCPNCIMEYREDIYKIQFNKHKPTTTVKAPYNSQITLMDLDSFGVKKSKVAKELEELTHSFIPKEWLDRHINDEYPEPTMELIVDEKSLHVNGNYEKGLISTFMERKPRKSKKLTTV